MKPKILILGSSGMLGHVVYHYLQSLNKYHVFVCPSLRKNLSVLTEVLDQLTPNVVINCVGVLVKESEDNKKEAIRINALFPHILNEHSINYHFKLIHISTDCIFSGATGRYTENSIPDATSVYGRTKMLGEIHTGNALTLRTSIIGPELKEQGTGLFHWFMKSIGIVNGYTNVKWGGVTTLELAKVIDYSIEENKAGLVHVTNGISISKYGLLQLISIVWDRKKPQLKPALSTDPKNLTLLSTRMEKDFPYKVPSYQTMLQDLKKWMQDYNFLYQQYGTHSS